MRKKVMRLEGYEIMLRCKMTVAGLLPQAPTATQ